MKFAAMKFQRRGSFARVLATIFVVCLCLAAAATAHAQTGREIMQEQDRRHGSKSEITMSTMTIKNQRGGVRERSMVVYSSEDDSGSSRSLLKFLDPRDIENVGLLTWQKPGDEEDDQWLYLPASRQTKRIVGGAKKNAFMGTDLAYEDMRAEDLKAHDYETVGEETVDGHPVWIVAATPATEEERRNSGYAKRILWIRKDNYMTVKTSFRDRRDREIKRATFSGLEQIEGQKWRANSAFYETMATGGSTLSTVDKREIEASIEESIFAPANISRRPRVR